MRLVKEPERITLVEGLTLLARHLPFDEAKERLRQAFIRKAFPQSPLFAFEYDEAEIDWSTGLVKIPRKREAFSPTFSRADFDAYFFADGKLSEAESSSRAPSGSRQLAGPPMTLTEELFQVADATANAHARLREETLRKALSAIERACGQAKRAWSGSNLGYHATVYCEGLEPPPPGVNFSPEWGIENRWPVNQPDPGWTEMDYQAVVDLILLRAAGPDIAAIEEVLKQLRGEFSVLKERTISLFTALQPNAKDTFLERKLRQIESLKVVHSGTIAQTLTNTPNWSRDSLAVSQGHRVAPHQALIAIPLSATVLENGLDALEKATRESALHLERIAQRKREMTATGKTVFIGHGGSPIWLELKEFLKDRLQLTVDEFNTVPPAGIPTVIRLEELLDRAAFAFLVMTAEDEQSDGTVRARENVVHEAGLFQGRLGFRKAIILMDDRCNEFSNIQGLGQIRFAAGNIKSSFEEIRRVLEREGLIATP